MFDVMAWQTKWQAAVTQKYKQGYRERGLSQQQEANLTSIRICSGVVNLEKKLV
jgi:hypothetical protein